MPKIYGMLRVRNEQRWIRRVLEAIRPLCDEIFVFDDHSADSTAVICKQLQCKLWNSQFSGIDESRDKDFLLSKMYMNVPAGDQHYTLGNPSSPYWALAIDGDEELLKGDDRIIRQAIMQPGIHAYHLRIPFLWNDSAHIRVDRVYRNFERLGRPSLFRLMNQSFRFLRTPFGNGANFHCSSIPQELLGHAKPCAARLMHWGYMDREDRIRKFYWYNTVDPMNTAEDCYRHMVLGDLPEYPANMACKHAGPLQLEAIQWQAS